MLLHIMYSIEFYKKYLQYLKPLLPVMVFLSLACDNPFAIRKAEEPKSPSSSWILPDSHNSVLINLRNAIKEKNTDNFMACLVDPDHSDEKYVFVPDPEILASHPDVFLDWGREKEEVAIKQAFFHVPNDSSASLEFYEDIKEIITADSAVTVKQYRLVLQNTLEGLPSIYEGQVEFRFKEDQRGWWIIYYWRDSSISDFEPWTFLKASLGI